MQFPATLAAAATLIAWLPAHAPAADSAGNFAVRGLGAQSCASVTAALAQPDEAARVALIRTLSAWVGGYLTHANRVTGSRFDAVPFVSDVDVLSIVVHRCEASPDALFETAAQEILAILAPFGTESMAPVADVEQSVALRLPTVGVLQQALIDRGLLAGKPDGVVGNATRAAIARFNAEQKTGEGSTVTVETVLRLLSGG
jgi:hypothetical protein